jgi:CBS domain-containing protein
MATTRARAGFVPHCEIYGRADVASISFPLCGHLDAKPERRSATVADRVPVTEIMSRDLICARPDLPVDSLLRLMIDRHVGCIPVVDERGRPRGVVTKSDLVEQLDLSLQRLGTIATQTTGDVMMPLAIAIDERATVAHAARMMELEDTHHVLIVSCGGYLVGVVSAKDIVRWLVVNDAS